MNMKNFAPVLIAILVSVIFSMAAAAKDENPAGDPRTDRLCAEAADPDAAPDKVFIHCRVETGDFAGETPPSFSGELTVAAYNIERGFGVDKQIDLFTKHPAFKNTDVLLLSESDRGCPRTDYRNITADIAKALGMNYAYAVEFVELPRGKDWKNPCEHGNAILSRYPMENVREIRHRQTGQWYIPPEDRHKGGEPRLGGRVAVAADILLGDTPVRVYAVHFESGLHDDDIRSAQAREIVDDAAGFGGPVIAGGDMNTHMYVLNLQGAGEKEPTVKVFTDAGYKDTHVELPLKKRGTTRMEYGMRTVIDLFFVKGFSAMDSGVCPGKYCDPLSDHLPVWTHLKMD